jgi:hypothetical protein
VREVKSPNHPAPYDKIKPTKKRKKKKEKSQTNLPPSLQELYIHFDLFPHANALLLRSTTA